VKIFPVNPEATLLISGLIDDWKAVEARRVSTLIDLEGGIDPGLPEVPNELLYVYFPIADEELPDLEQLHSVARLAAHLSSAGQVVLIHCVLGLNRSNLLAAVALTYTGLTGEQAVSRLRSLQPGALYNEHFLSYALGLPARKAPTRNGS
jgi:protein-tyrosine phosphatase